MNRVEQITDEILEYIRPAIRDKVGQAIDDQVKPALATTTALQASGARMAYSLAEAAAVLSISASCLKELVYSGRIRSVKLDRRRLIPRTAIELFLTEETARAGEDLRRRYDESSGYVR